MYLPFGGRKKRSEALSSSSSKKEERRRRGIVAPAPDFPTTLQVEEKGTRDLPGLHPQKKGIRTRSSP